MAVAPVQQTANSSATTDLTLKYTHNVVADNFLLAFVQQSVKKLEEQSKKGES